MSGEKDIAPFRFFASAIRQDKDALFLLVKFLSVEIQLRDATRISCHLWFLHVIKILGT